jgi:transforming growth factor-beta-induced protein
MRKMSKWVVAVAMVGLAGMTSSARAAGKDIVDTAVAAGSFNTLAAALQAAGLVEALKGEGPFTVFAPTDDAFANLPAGTVEALLKPENKEQLVAVLTYHVVKGKVPAAKVLKLTGATTLNGQRVDVTVNDGQVRVDNANVVKTDIECSNGIIHVIDAVVLPAADDLPTTAAKAGSFSTLLAAAKAAGLVEALSGEGPLTVFAPTDEAFAKLPAGTVDSLLKPENKGKLAAILKYHVVSGRVYSTDALAAGQATSLQGGKLKITASDSGAHVNGAKLLATDIDSSNGVIHVIDSVILPPTNEQSRAPSACQQQVSAVALRPVR